MFRAQRLEAAVNRALTLTSYIATRCLHDLAAFLGHFP